MAQARFALPPNSRTQAGEMRRIGVELEFSGMDIDTICQHAVEVLGGTLTAISDYEVELVDTEFGTFRVELDFAWLKKQGKAQSEGKLSRLEGLGSDLVGNVSQHIAPHELVTPPIPMDRLDVLVPLIQRLHDSGARGTYSNPVYAYGLHLNPELPDLEPATLTAYIQAYACLSDWLIERSNIDFSRQVTPYIDRWPRDYHRLVCAPDYAPDATALIDDYLAHNPTRNRALDMLPSLVMVDEKRVRAAVDDDRVKGRPALHYRLPNCQIDEPKWGLDEPWADWLEVEKLAADHDRRSEMMAAYLAQLNGPAGGWVNRLLGTWADDCQQWLSR